LIWEYVPRNGLRVLVSSIEVVSFDMKIISVMLILYWHVRLFTAINDSVLLEYAYSFPTSRSPTDTTSGFGVSNRCPA
jgi:hypothetical protein